MTSTTLTSEALQRYSDLFAGDEAVIGLMCSLAQQEEVEPMKLSDGAEMAAGYLECPVDYAAAQAKERADLEAQVGVLYAELVSSKVSFDAPFRSEFKYRQLAFVEPTYIRKMTEEQLALFHSILSKRESAQRPADIPVLISKFFPLLQHEATLIVCLVYWCVLTEEQQLDSTFILELLRCAKSLQLRAPAALANDPSFLLAAIELAEAERFRSNECQLIEAYYAAFRQLTFDQQLRAIALNSHNVLAFVESKIHGKLSEEEMRNLRACAAAGIYMGPLDMRDLLALKDPSVVASISAKQAVSNSRHLSHNMRLSQFPLNADQVDLARQFAQQNSTSDLKERRETNQTIATLLVLLQATNGDRLIHAMVESATGLNHLDKALNRVAELAIVDKSRMLELITKLEQLHHPAAREYLFYESSDGLSPVPTVAQFFDFSEVAVKLLMEVVSSRQIVALVWEGTDGFDRDHVAMYLRLFTALDSEGKEYLLRRIAGRYTSDAADLFYVQLFKQDKEMAQRLLNAMGREILVNHSPLLQALMQIDRRLIPLRDQAELGLQS